MANYIVPHTAVLQGGLKPGSMIRIKGAVPANGNCLEVNLCCKGSGADKALHCNPRLDEEVAVFNAFQEGVWGREERIRSHLFQRGQPFDLLITVMEDSYKAAMGGNVFHSFKHRLPLNQVQVLEVMGDVHLEHVSVL